jgi:hypothetical protein
MAERRLIELQRRDRAFDQLAGFDNIMPAFGERRYRGVGF